MDERHRIGWKSECRCPSPLHDHDVEPGRVQCINDQRREHRQGEKVRPETVVLYPGEADRRLDPDKKGQAEDQRVIEIWLEDLQDQPAQIVRGFTSRLFMFIRHPPRIISWILR